MAAIDDQIRETVNRLLDSLRGRLESELGSSRDELIQAAQDAHAQAELQLTEARESAARDAEEQRAKLTAELEDLQHRLEDTKQDAERRNDESRSRIDKGQREIDGLRVDLEAARKQLDETRDDVEATLLDIESTRRDSDAARLEVSRLTDLLRHKEKQAAQALRLPDAMRTLDEAATFGEVLENLARSAAGEAGRAAVFLVKGNRLRDWRTVGFDFASDAARLDIDLSDAGPMADAVRSGEGVYPGGDSPVPDFARTDEARHSAAWPVSVGGSVVAVLYADSPVADTSDELYWPAFLDVLARHAGRVLEGITVRQAAGLMTGGAPRMSSSSVGRQSSGSIQ